MRNSVIAGIVLGTLVAFWTLIMGITGWYKHPAGAFAFMLVIPINIAVVIWGLTKSRRDGRRYGGQVVAGLVMGGVGAAIIFANSLLFTQLLFPSYFDDLRAMQAEILANAGLPEDRVREQIEKGAAMQTPLAQASAGAIGTIVTSAVTALVGAIFIRKKN